MGGHKFSMESTLKRQVDSNNDTFVNIVSLRNFCTCNVLRLGKFYVCQTHNQFVSKNSDAIMKLSQSVELYPNKEHLFMPFVALRYPRYMKILQLEFQNGPYHLDTLKASYQQITYFNMSSFHITVFNRLEFLPVWKKKGIDCFI